MRLSNGNYLFLYNSARKYGNNNFQYNLGWVILSGDDPTQILERSEEPILTPELGWEVGQSPPWLDLTNYVVFIEGWRQVGIDLFQVYYGAADSVIGSAFVCVGESACSSLAAMMK